MRTVRDEAGDRYLLVKRSSESSLVRDPDTGEERYLPNADLTVDDETAALETAASAVPASVRRVLTAAPNDRALGLLIELADRGPLAVRTLIDSYDLCESDLHGLLAEFRAAGLVEEARIAGERGYDATATTRDAVTHLRADD
ncbi:hypothetical protein SAMN04488065_1070 [Haloplanus vescus]|uniref:HTH domain protein n=1 Tax=Haloplanus vescus TaxID=555874 RepID=A0A1H3WQX6_9EURY|nr:hypothetical protein [Haloplanus vescus]SDZ89545.1 hypothetical protein SAMN04488065_1070 [Haloplanus vescus]